MFFFPLYKPYYFLNAAFLVSLFVCRFGKSNIAYITWIIGGVLVGEFVTGYGIDSMWSSVNSGRTYDQIDWTKFKVEDDEDDEDDEEDEEEEGEGEEEGGDDGEEEDDE